MHTLQRLFEKIPFILNIRKRKITLAQHHHEINEVRAQLQSKIEEIEKGKQVLENYWNTIITAAKSEEVNFGSIDQALNYITTVTANSLGVSRVSIWRYHSESPERIECIAAFDRDINQHFTQQTLVQADNAPYFEAIKREKVIAAENASNHADTSEFASAYLQPRDIKSLMDSPFFLDGKLAGVLCCEQQRHTKSWSGEDIIFATSMAEIVSLAFRSIAQRMYEKDLESFSYSVAHDLRTPLRNILGFANILTEDYGQNLDKDGLRLLEIVKGNASRMSALIDSLLDFSRLNKLPLKKSMVDMSILVKAIIEEQLSSLDNDSKVQFRVTETHDLYCDHTLIRQVLSNLISNAIKYSGKKPRPVIEVNSVKSDDMVIYSVKDNGAGFDMKYADKLFKVFHRLHGAMDFPGTGVGLAIVHRIISKHNGTVWAESAVDEGAVFHFSLPIL